LRAGTGRLQQISDHRAGFMHDVCGGGAHGCDVCGGVILGTLPYLLVWIVASEVTAAA
jgi:hypothetical protein